MGVAYDAGRLAVATRDRIFVWQCARPTFELAATHVTGRLDAHEIAFDARGLVFANTRFNCVARPSERANFRRSWTPPFMGAAAQVTARVAKDCCHLNGLGVRAGRVAAVTAFCTGAEPGSWRGADRFTSGVLLEAPSGATLAANLCLPHSPRWHGGAWWFCNSGEGTLCRMPATEAPQNEPPRIVAALPGFTRGLAFAAGRAIVGLSRIRKRHILDAPPVRQRFAQMRSGLWLVDPATGHATGALEFLRGGREVFDAAFLPGVTRPTLPLAS